MKTSVMILTFVLCLNIGLTEAQNVSDEARRHFDRGQAAVEMAKTPADYEDAVKEFENAATLAPDWPDVYYNLGLIQEKVGKRADAIRNLTKYLELSPNANDSREVKKFIAKIEYKMEKEEGIKSVYGIMTSGVYVRNAKYNYPEMLWSNYERKEIPNLADSSNMLNIFRMVSGKMQVSNVWYLRERSGLFTYHPKQHPPIPREWEPVKVNGRFYEYTFSYYMDIARGYVVRYDCQVKGEIILIDPPRVKEISKFSIPWGAPIGRQRRPWHSNNNFGATKERIVEWRTK